MLLEALEVIRYSNPFPYTTGLTCDHVCEDRCTRMNYDETLQIREIKRFLAFQEEKVEQPKAKADRKEKIAIIGGGPSGLSCAYYMRLEGFQVEIFEAKDILDAHQNELRLLPIGAKNKYIYSCCND